MAKKYIDADCLKAEIERLYYDEAERDKSILAADAYKNALDAIEKFVNSIEQDKETLDLCSQVWWENLGWIMIPPNVTLKEIDSLLKQVKKKLQQEQKDVISHCFDNIINLSPQQAKWIARHFYKPSKARKK